MNEIRKNKETETEIVRATFRIPISLILEALLIELALLILGIVCVSRGGGLKWLGIVLFVIFGILGIYFLLRIINIKRNEFVLTNKRIDSAKAFGFGRKSTFTCRLEEISDVNMQSIWGHHRINFVFQNHDKSFTIDYVGNYNEVYSAISDVLVSVKNKEDVEIDVKMKGIEAEEKKADAMKTYAEGTVINKAKENYILELKELRELYKDGTITKAEFEKKKRKLLE